MGTTQMEKKFQNHHVILSREMWLLTLYLLPPKSIRNFSVSSESIKTHSLILKNSSGKVIFQDAKS